MVLLLLAGVDPASYLSGVIAGIIGFGAVVVLVEWRRVANLEELGWTLRCSTRPEGFA
jgi:hypothetical protein